MPGVDVVVSVVIYANFALFRRNLCDAYLNISLIVGPLLTRRNPIYEDVYLLSVDVVLLIMMTLMQEKKIRKTKKIPVQGLSFVF